MNSTINETTKFITVAKADDIPAGSKKRFLIEGRKILIAHCGDGYFAVDDTCTHAESSLAEGYLYGCEIECEAHGARFDLATGEVRALPAVVPLRVYRTIVENGDVKVDLS